MNWWGTKFCGGVWKGKQGKRYTTTGGKRKMALFKRKKKMGFKIKSKEKKKKQ